MHLPQMFVLLIASGTGTKPVIADTKPAVCQVVVLTMVDPANSFVPIVVGQYKKVWEFDHPIYQRVLPAWEKKHTLYLWYDPVALAWSIGAKIKKADDVVLRIKVNLHQVQLYLALLI
jgi:hypothetical protein